MDTKNKLYFGDNLKILRDYVEDASVDLIYLDPPFNSSATCNVSVAPVCDRRVLLASSGVIILPKQRIHPKGRDACPRCLNHHLHQVCSTGGLHENSDVSGTFSERRLCDGSRHEEGDG
ncbi:MAG: RsmD family RNA methyltransferase [Acidobacteriia bacterium]|nr:RsmD family RNA methyltransferase [Terriglobia bacterium]